MDRFAGADSWMRTLNSTCRVARRLGPIHTPHSRQRPTLLKALNGSRGDNHIIGLPGSDGGL